MNSRSVTSVSEYIALIEKLEKNKVHWFRGVADVKYKPLPGLIWKNALRREGAMEHDFLVAYKSYVANQHLNSWEIYAMMQHHGLPTRLIDWSESALVALYFSLTSEPNKEGSRGVWILKPSELNRLSTGADILYCPAVIQATTFAISEKKTINFDKYLPPNLTISDDLEYPELPLAIYASKHIKRIASQKGCFTVHGSDKRSIDEFLTGENCYLVEICLSSEQDRKKMISTLDSLGIDEEFIYQDLDSLCNRITRQWIR